jgi:RNA polymerase sigma-54 factor
VNRTGYSQRLELRQTQSLVMTPQLQQAIKMLQLSNLELAQFVDAEVQQNPLLERREMRFEDGVPANATAIADSPTATPLSEAAAADFAPEAAEHWHAAAGVEGDGSVDRGGEAHL